jgi:ArsR family transcriptional regulator, virulence genes transcriptional regulator
MQAELCQAMSQPARLQILHALFEGAKNVGEIAEATNLGQSTVSRHLAILRQRGIVNFHRQGQEIYYEVANPKIIEVCNMMRSVLLEQINERSNILTKSQ